MAWDEPCSLSFVACGREKVLRHVPFFADMGPAKLKLLAFMSERVSFDPVRQSVEGRFNLSCEVPRSSFRNKA